MTKEEFIQSIALEGEEWRDVVGYEGIYMVSNYARVISIKTDIEDKLRTRTKEPKLISVQQVLRNNKLYNNVRLYKNKKSRLLYLHRIVAEAFIPNPNNYPEVDHLDRNGLNNIPNNLRWCTHKENQNNINTKSAMVTSHLNVQYQTRWKPVVQLRDGNIVKVYQRMMDAESDGFSHVGIIHVIKGKSKQHKGYQWMYLSDYESLTNKSKNILPAPITADYPQ